VNENEAVISQVKITKEQIIAHFLVGQMGTHAQEGIDSTCK
jgi:hypothetical protein